MPFLKTYKLNLVILLLALVICFFINISLGSINIPLRSIFSTLLGSNTENETWRYIVLNFRIPKAITAILTGCSLSLSGLLMQTLFRNPLAGPFVLGISSGASLGVAVLVMGASLLGGITSSTIAGNATLAIAASIGSFAVLSVVIIVASRVRDTMALLIIGLMFGSITAAIVSVLSYFSTMENLQQYIFWSYGSLGNLSWNQIILFSVFFFAGIVLVIFSIKPLNSLLLGENYARSMGLDIKKSRYLIIFATSILAGSATSFAGPIAFVGLAVPHLTKQIFNTANHQILIPAVLIYGALLMLICDTIAQLPNSAYTLPINAITSMVGAPVVIWLLIRKRKMIF
ncbi:FecCD family ABC transporter permease [Abyssalbus ytuae]|uniref:Iron ABC transporter permease n=1 Tax=Abyssalbus ytuae TaxID=2926907 RepID=A0A9E7D085_9FLAO|nr:iron ABC transporter permease [Abyssalbus ytuae]UOB18220.1 iron ABC transporter permease [Abyssalbus ytuae]